MIFFFSGEEDFLALQKIKEIKELFAIKHPTARIDVFDLEEDDFRSVKKSMAQGGGLFSEKKLVVLKNVFDIQENEKGELAEMLKNLSKDISAIFFQKKIKNKKGKLYNFVKKNSESEVFKKIKGAELKKWISGEVKKRSDNEIFIDNSALDRLEVVARNDLWRINQEIDKLVDFKEKKETIGVQDVNNLCSGEAEAQIFGLVDAIGQKNRELAIDLIFNLQNQGKNSFYIFSMVMYQIKNLTKIMDCQGNEGVISKKLKLHPFVVKKTKVQLLNFNKNDLKSKYQLATDIDYQVKTGDLNMEEALTDFVAKI
jgi:DNA polymerase III subunit delta